VSEEYAKELSTARQHAIEVERVSDDPPERISGWLGTVTETEVRRLDQQLLLDLLQIEKREDAWRKVLDTSVGHIEQMMLSSNVPFAQAMLDAIVAAGAEGQAFAKPARDGLERLRKGPVMKHVVSHIRQAPDGDLKDVAAFCRTLGPTVIGSLAEALASEQSKATVNRLREILLSFGAAGRAYADELRSSKNPAVRRTAIELLRAFGGADALPDLTALLDDAEAAVQREALRAIVQIGTDEAYGALEHALKSGTARTRDAMMQVLGSSRDERAAPLFIYILQHTDYRGPLEGVYLSAIEALGKVGGEADSAEALRKVLYRGEWWAPFRTARMREAAAHALRMSGSDAAKRVLEQAAVDGSRSVRRIARAALAAPAPRAATRRAT
jgi:HEAT repeat protein